MGVWLTWNRQSGWAKSTKIAGIHVSTMWLLYIDWTDILYCITCFVHLFAVLCSNILFFELFLPLLGTVSKMGKLQFFGFTLAITWLIGDYSLGYERTLMDFFFSFGLIVKNILKYLGNGVLLKFDTLLLSFFYLCFNFASCLLDI